MSEEQESKENNLTGAVFSLKRKIAGLESDSIPIIKSPTKPTDPNVEVLIEAYHQHDFKLLTSDGEVLKGLRVDYEDIEKLKTDNPTMNKIYIAFAVDHDDYHNNEIPLNEKAFTTILIPLETGGPYGEVIGTKGIDFCDPCPPICPCSSNPDIRRALHLGSCT